MLAKNKSRRGNGNDRFAGSKNPQIRLEPMTNVVTILPGKNRLFKLVTTPLSISPISPSWNISVWIPRSCECRNEVRRQNERPDKDMFDLSNASARFARPHLVIRQTPQHGIRNPTNPHLQSRSIRNQRSNDAPNLVLHGLRLARFLFRQRFVVPDDIVEGLVVDKRLAVCSRHVFVDYCDHALGGFGGGEGGGDFGSQGAVAVAVRRGQGEEGDVGS